MTQSKDTESASSPALRPASLGGNVKLRERPRCLITLIFAAAALLLLATMIFDHQIGLIRTRAQQQMADELLVLQQLEDFISALKDSETGQRGYLLTGEESYLQPYTNVRTEVQTRLKGLQSLVSAGQLPKEKVDRVTALTQEKFSELELTIQLRREKGFDSALSEVRSDRGRQLMNQIRAEITSMRTGEEKDFADARRQADHIVAVRTATFIGVIIVNLAFLAWAFSKIIREVRQREAARLEVSREKELLSTTLASIGDAVIATNTEGRISFLNPQAALLTGWQTSEAANHLLSEVFHITNEVSGLPAENPADKVLRLGTVAGLANHTILTARDGRKIPIDDSAAPIREPDGPLHGVVLVFRDVTQQREAQKAAAHLSAIVQFCGDAVLTKNLDGIVQSWNASAERLFGYRADEIIGKHVTILFPPDRLTEEDHILGRLREGRPVERLETLRVAKDGRHIPVSVSVSPLKDSEGNVIGASKIIHDITELVAAREALVREKELLSTTLASIGDAVIVTDSRGLVTFLNAEAERLTGWQTPDAAGQPLPEVFRIINEETRQGVENPVDKVLRLGVVVGLANHTILISKSGSEIPIDDSAAPIRRKDGPLYGVVLVFRDFTERKQLEYALRNKGVELERLVTERTAKLQEMVGELKHVSYAIVHDMRAPLRAMNAFAETLLTELSANPATSAEHLDFCHRIIIAAGRLDKLIQDSLSYTKAVLQEVPLKPVALSPLIRGLIETYPNLQPDKADIRIEENLPVVLGEESLLTQCFSNLLGNAVKFVPKGVRPQISLRAEPGSADGLVRIVVQDNGIGIAAPAQARLFGMFQRLTADYEGTGIGLAIVRKVTERMGGHADAESEPGMGSRFWVELRTPNSTESPSASDG
jgi:PAS domain S-box-containing protein